MSRPRIAVLLDENTSTGGTRYDMTKAYFTAVHNAGGSPFGIPYFADMVPEVVEGFDGFLAVGGRFAYPDAWYVPGEVSPSPASERLAVERGLMQGFLAADKPVLGLCAGMQMLACLHGGRLVPDIHQLGSGIGEHDRREVMHPVVIAQGSKLGAIVGSATLDVNSFHREAVVEPGEGISVTARAPDGIIEAIERPESRFAIGLQWHQELLSSTDHPGNRIFKAFVRAC